MKNVLYCILWVFIGMVAATDVYWSIITQEQLYDIELNPIGRYLINKADGDVALFMGLKVAGTVVVLGVLTLLYKYKKRWAWACMITLTVVQVLVLWTLLRDGGPTYYHHLEIQEMKQKRRLELEKIKVKEHADL